ncbi:beta-glucosidase [Paenibacillus sp. BIHB 4019]|uniref:Beta-glucosidase n=1 Tax=Paenibacillus sp. BIHB 4019 TaxID=1870819 RepID=A0A1B2DQC5_9BACL|nr:glycoside hydrolase family 3 protein [Paenibacillus sp. BIHB 4019]ANY69911.1 beta-glucosidase [Paenibacillus sp. BIHB 4019]
MNITVAWEDVISVIQQIAGYLIVIGVALLAMIAVLILARRAGKPKSKFIRIQSVIAFFMILLIMVNAISLGPLENLISISLAEKGSLSAESAASSRETIEKVAEEGIVMTKNVDNILPLIDKNINVFGWASTNPIYGGTGSGSVDISTAVGILSGLENAGFKLNTELSDMYKAYRTDRPVVSINDGQDWTLPEPPVTQYSNEMLTKAKQFSDTALIVIGRVGGEGADLPHDMGGVMDGSWNEPGTKYRKATYHNNSPDYSDFKDGQTFLELSQTEKNLVDMVTKNFKKVVVVYNGSNTFEMGWTNEYEQIKGVILAGGTGVTGFNALGNILTGKVNPSGKTSDTWVNDLTVTPYFENIGHFAYTNVDEVVSKARQAWAKSDGVASFVNYVEGIYTGYRFYETASTEGLIDYDKAVQYPFGYGLSYTTFNQQMGVISEKNGSLTFEVTVSNTGSVAGKDVVEVYYNPPYTNGGIEKSSANLIGFEKTKILAPGESQKFTFNLSLDDMASYDTTGDGRYVLEAGDYAISLRTDSHHIVDEQVYTLHQNVIYDETNLRSGDKAAATNQLQFAEGDVSFLSRANKFANYTEVVAAPTDFEVKGELLANGTYDPTKYNNAADVMPVQGVNNGLEAFDLRGKDYDDPKWEDLLSQITVDEMVNFIAYGGFGTTKIDSIHLPATVIADGPAGVNSFVTQSFGTGYPSENLLAQTWNVDMAYEVAEGIIKELQDFKIHGWYGPSMNLHRSAFNGRNFEYYSEDPILSAKMAMSETQAAHDNKIIPFLKHFAFNEQETNRNALLCTWLSEQAARELYLKPFEKTVGANDGSPLAIMSVFNYIGTEWGGSTSALLNHILRDEWGFRGMVLTDYFGNYGYMDADRAVRGGSDLMLGTAGNEAIMTDLSATSVIAMRHAVKNSLYTIVNSSVYENYTGYSTPAWIKIIYIADAVLFVILALLEVALIRSYKRKRKMMTD